MQWISSHVSFESLYWNINIISVLEEDLCTGSSKRWLSIPNWKQIAVASQDNKKDFKYIEVPEDSFRGDSEHDWFLSIKWEFH